MQTLTLRLDDARYPSRLRALAQPPPEITTSGNALNAASSIAIIGTRDCTRPAWCFAYDLARRCAEAGVVVVSGGASGIDTAAHHGALDAGGSTWAVAGSGSAHVYPKENASLFDAIAASAGAMIWPFPRDTAPIPANFLLRNSVLVALADVVVIAQAGVPSGALSAAKWARKLGKPVWVCPGPPWDEKFTGCASELDRGALPITSVDAFLSKALGFAPPATLRPRRRTSSPSHPLLRIADDHPTTPDAPPWFDEPTRILKVTPPASRESTSDTGELTARFSANELALLAASSREPQHVDEIAMRARICARDAATGLLTLALDNVLVEGPEGFYRRGN